MHREAPEVPRETALPAETTGPGGAHARTDPPVSGEPGEGRGQELLEHAAGELVEEPGDEGEG